jgi:UDP-N-acetyl-D-glucosamine dehydrogenase
MHKIHTIAIIGLGYVGLPLALLANRKGFKTYGLDIDPAKIGALANKVSYIDDVTDIEIAKSSAVFSVDLRLVKKADAVIICVPTPVNHNKEPDLGPVKSAVKAVAPYLKNGTLVIIESTVNPGVCDDIVIPLLEDVSGKTVGKEIFVAHCPERINPGDKKWNVSNINRVVGANSEKELAVAVELYEGLIDAKIKPMGSLKEAEAVKVVENSFRDINIAFVNELAMSFDKLGINVNNVIDGAATKPFAFMPHYPGIGVGGHCIPVDPYYLIEYARDNGFEHKFISLARSINEAMPVYSVDKLEQAYIRRAGKTLKDAHVTVLGLSYKPDVADDRESPSYAVISTLQERGANVTVYDPYFPDKSDALSLEAALENKNVIIIATNHAEFVNLPVSFIEKASVLLDGRNALKHRSREIEDVGIVYLGIGVN